jgi:aspartyl protease family protein
MRNIILFAAAALLLAAATTRFTGRASVPQPAPKAAAATALPAPNAGARTFAVGRERDGHFHVEATVGGRRLPLMVDTGASLIALTERDAERLAIRAGQNAPKLRIHTANGVVLAAQVRIDSVSIGGLTVRDVEAVVMPAGALSQNLLGMSFLSRLKRYEFRGSQLVLEQ